MLSRIAARPWETLPELGAVVRLPALNVGGRWVVESYPVTFGVRPDPRTVAEWHLGSYRPFRPMSHCVNLRRLGTEERRTVSAHWCEVEEASEARALWNAHRGQS